MRLHILDIAAKPFGPFGISMAPIWLATASILLYVAAFSVMVAGMSLLKGDAMSVAVAGFCTIVVFIIGGSALYCYFVARLAFGRYLTLKAGSSPSAAVWRVSIAAATLAGCFGLLFLLGVATRPIHSADMPRYVFGASIVSVSLLWLYECTRAIRAAQTPTRHRAFLIELAAAHKKRVAEAPPPPLVSITKAKRRAGQAYMRVAGCPALRASNKIMNWSLLMAHLYALLLCLLGLSPTGIALRDHWIQMTAPLTELVTHIVPNIGKIGGDLASRGYGSRVPFVTNVLAIYWPLFAVPTMAACIKLFPERFRFEEAERAWNAEYKHLRSGGSPWWRSFAPIVFVSVMAFVLLYGKSYHLGRQNNFDFANNLALFIPGLMFVACFWIGLYFIWLYMLPTVARLSSRGSKGVKLVRTR